MTSAPRTILDNFSEWRSRWGIVAPIEQIEVKPDRLFFYEPMAEGGLIDFALRHAWDLSEPRNHGASVIVAFRERASPSANLNVHRARSATTGKVRLFYEFDFDKAPPLLNRPRFYAEHVGECLLNCLTGGLTDQDDIYRRMLSYWSSPAGLAALAAG